MIGDEDAGPPAEEHPPRGVLKRLHDVDWQHARRTVMRLHRNLGHPTQEGAGEATSIQECLGCLD